MHEKKNDKLRRVRRKRFLTIEEAALVSFASYSMQHQKKLASAISMTNVGYSGRYFFCTCLCLLNCVFDKELY